MDVGKELNCQRLSAFTVGSGSAIFAGWNFTGAVFSFFSHFGLRCCIISHLDFLKATFFGGCQRFAPSLMRRMEFFFSN